ncbi:4Fe-4S binding protein [Clostridiaceae bacterium M8S5]|nr:4Fe-4S binding protein [Clostridiaceae bacterium M8S5]
MAKFNRTIVQVISAIITNSNFKGFYEGKIYQGFLKKGCVPGLNCYSCPGAVGSCPIGSLQAVLGSMKYKMSFYIFGFLIFIGAILGRFVCGWLCPFGLIQDLLNKIPSPKMKLPAKLRYVKYVILLVFVIILPVFFVNRVGMGDPAFCKYICPAGTLEAGLPLVYTNPVLKMSIGTLYYWKIGLLVVTIIASIIIFRPFCRVICPLGAIYGLFNPLSMYRYRIDGDKCTNCSKCYRVCKMDIKTHETPNSKECIRCGDCIKACPSDAIKLDKFKKKRH